MPSRCFAYGCTSGYSNKANKGKKFHFYSAPKNNPELFEKWKKIMALNRSDREFTTESALCHLHFTEDMIMKEYSVTATDGTVLTSPLKVFHLKKYAYPCKNLKNVPIVLEYDPNVIERAPKILEYDPNVFERAPKILECDPTIPETIIPDVVEEKEGLTYRQDNMSGHDDVITAQKSRLKMTSWVTSSDDEENDQDEPEVKVSTDGQVLILTPNFNRSRVEKSTQTSSNNIDKSTQINNIDNNNIGGATKSSSSRITYKKLYVSSVKKYETLKRKYERMVQENSELTKNGVFVSFENLSDRQVSYVKNLSRSRAKSKNKK